ncbi:hypothetical protein SDC9_134591 [bioreactor metagenome]|uniref:Uncharacterized protein n=1 Tax=bioreactor metagenome TaxID=1076179 RepID=A0A645DE47_9ZZZZ
MEPAIAAKCPNCGAPVYPYVNWFECPTCGSYIRFEEDAHNGHQYMCLGTWVNGQIRTTERQLVQIIEQEGQQTRAELQVQQGISKDGFDKMGRVSYLIFLALQRTEVREQIHELERKPTAQQNSYEINLLRTEISSLNKRIKNIDDQVRPDKEAVKRTSSSSSDAAFAILESYYLWPSSL